jgi:hypothetical protein
VGAWCDHKDVPTSERCVKTYVVIALFCEHEEEEFRERGYPVPDILERDFMVNAESDKEAVAYAISRKSLVSPSYVVYDWNLNRTFVNLKDVVAS